VGYFISYTGTQGSQPQPSTSSSSAVAFSPATAPGYTFVGDKTSGMGATAAASVYLAVSGASVISFTPTNCTVAVPIGLTGALSGQGASFAGAVQLAQGLSVMGVAALSGGVTLAHGAQLLNDTPATPNGTIAAPPGSLYLSTSGGAGSTLWVKEQNLDATGWRAFIVPGQPNFPLLAPNQTAIAPAYSFSASAGTGVFSPVVNALGFSTNQVERLRIDATGALSAYGPVSVTGAFTGQAGASFVGTASVSMGGNLAVTGNISAANINGGVTGAASQNVLKAGDTMTGALQINVAAGTSALSTMGNVLFTGTLQVTALSTLASLTVTGPSNLGNTTINGTVAVSGTTTLTGALSGSAGTFTGALSAQSFAASAAGTAASAAFTVQNAGLYYDTVHAGLGFAIAGSQVAYLNAAGLTVLGTLNSSNLSGNNTGDVTLGTANGLSLVGQVLSHGLASSTAAGALSAADYTAFSAKAPSGSYVTSLTGDVTATGPGASAATVALVGGSTAALVHAAELLANAATAANTASTLVKRDAAGAFAAGVLSLTGSTFIEQAADLAQAISLYVKADHNLYFKNSTGVISQLNNPATTFPLLAPNGTVAAPSYAFAGATSTGIYYDTAHTGLGIDVAGVQAAYFSATGLIIAGAVAASNLSGSNTGDITLGAAANGLTLVGQVLSHQLASSTQPGALSAADYATFSAKAASGAYITALTGDVTATGPGTAAATVALVGGSTAALVHSAELLANAAVSTNTPSTLVKRDASGGFAAGVVGVVGNTFVEQAADLTQAISIYVKADHNLYFKNSTGVVSQLNNPSAAVTFPLAAPTGTTAAPNYPYSFSGNTTSGLGYDTTQGGSVLYAAGNAALTALTTGVVRVPGKLSVASTVPGNALFSVGDNSVNDGQYPVQINSTTGNNGVFYGVTNGTAGVAGCFGYNLYQSLGYLEGTLIRTLNAKPFYLLVNNSPTYALSASSTGNVGIGSSTLALNKLDVFGSMAIGANVAGVTAAPASGLLVQGPTVLQGNLALTEAATAPAAIANAGQLYAKSVDHNLYFKNNAGTEYALTPPGSVSAAPRNVITNGSGANFQATAAQTGSLFTLPGGSSIILPPATLGLEYQLVITSGSPARFVAGNNTDTITFNGALLSGVPAAVYIQSVGQVITLTCWTAGQWIATYSTMPGYTELQEQAAPASISASTSGSQSNTGLLYAKTDHNLYFKNSLGAEYPLTPTGSSQVIGTGGNVTATSAQSGSVAIMTGPGTLTLPSATAALAGSVYTLTNAVATNIAIQTASGDTIYYADPITGTNALTNKASGTNYTIIGAPIGATFKVLCVGLNKWVTVTLKGAGWA
jgi:hypothetical protein